MRELEIKDWRGKTWRVQFEKHLADGEWAIDWKVLSPDGSVRSEIESDRELPRRCLNQFRQLDDYWLVWEFKWWVNHYTNTLDLKKLRARRGDRD
ncbi:hypothetical protein [Coleofasciculus sp.]|uniref:hypothetical protein n=1 Tax=Coleofasciculus sp. TaxID=3100458 RepID=UPI003A19863D